MAHVVLHADDLSKSYTRGAKALAGFSLEIRAGEIVGLLGENGAGKTTALRLLTGLLKPDTGRVRIAGINFAADRAAALRKAGALFGAEPGLYERLTGRENIIYFARLNGVPARDAARRAAELCTRLRMSDYADKRVASYSTGMRQKTALARSVVHEPEVLLFDEPTSGLDVSATDLIHDFLLSQQAAGRGVLFSSHAVEEVERLSTRVVVLARGVTVADGPIDTLPGADGDFRARFKTMIGRQR